MSYLGKRFQQTIKAQLDMNFVEDCLRGIEFLKLEILDCAEAHQRPPAFYDVNWAYTLYRSQDYRFIWDEFATWARQNGLEWTFQHNKDDVRLVINVREQDYSNEIFPHDFFLSDQHSSSTLTTSVPGGGSQPGKAQLPGGCK